MDMWFYTHLLTRAHSSHGWLGRHGVSWTEEFPISLDLQILTFTENFQIFVQGQASWLRGPESVRFPAQSYS